MYAYSSHASHGFSFVFIIQLLVILIIIVTVTNLNLQHESYSDMQPSHERHLLQLQSQVL